MKAEDRLLNLIPIPKKIKELTGFFDTSKAQIKKLGNADLEKLLSELLDTYVSSDGNVVLHITDNSDNEDYTLKILPDEIDIEGSEKGIFYAVSTLRQLIYEYGNIIPCLEISDSPDFSVRGFYFDITRGRVPKLETLFRLCDKMALYKMNHLELYVEHSFEYTGMEEIWGDKSPITREEIKALDSYCRRLNIEFVPSFALFGHLYEILRHKKFAHLSELEPTDDYSWQDRMRHHTLDITNPESFELVKGMIDDVIDLFSSDKFNICCDETFDLGQGKSKEYVEKVGVGNAYLEFVSKIACYVQAKGKQVMVWGDIVLNHKELIDKMPKGLIMLNWDYTKEPSETNIEAFEKAGAAQIVCPGCSGWNKMINDYDTAINNISKSSELAKKHNAIGLLTTDWGDWGHLNCPEYSFPMLAFAAGKSWNTGASIENKDISKFEGINTDSIDKLILLQEYTLVDFRDVSADCMSILKGDAPSLVTKHSENDYLSSIEKISEAINDIPDYSLGLRGSALLHKVAMCFSMKKSIVGLTTEIEDYIDEYSAIWLKDYKPSELNKIVNMFYNYIHIINSYKV